MRQGDSKLTGTGGKLSVRELLLEKNIPRDQPVDSAALVKPQREGRDEDIQK